ncbi:peptidoglycan-binding protein [Streptomyces sp. NPDC126933]|uniref:peptidoglycan-binding domain-containing protein n=1 Tax=unclassified Streptomyces TaxID=2593676 RepID=UPI0036587762
MTGQLCPACGTPRAAEGRPDCDCAERAVRAVQAGRSEEVAASEDFDPLRIRPYVTLDTEKAAPTAFRTAGPLPPLAVKTSSARPPAAELYPSPPPARRAPFRAVAIGAAAVAVIGTAAFAGGLFSGSGHQRAMPEETYPGPPTASAPERDASASPSPSPSASATPSVTAPSPRATPSAPRSTSPEAPRSSAPAKPTPPAPEQPLQAPPGASLSRGDSGPEVVELQNRLAEIWLFRGASDGRYDERVEGAVRVYQSYKNIEGDPQGVYGPNTRRALEAESQGRGRRH